MDQSFVFTATMAPGHRCVFVQFYEIGHLSIDVQLHLFYEGVICAPAIRIHGHYGTGE